MNFEKLKEVYVCKRTVYKNLSHVSNNYYGFGNIKQLWKALFAVKSSFYREDCGEYKIHHTKLNEIFLPKRPIYKNLSQFFHSDFKIRDKCTSLQDIFQTL